MFDILFTLTLTYTFIVLNAYIIYALHVDIVVSRHVPDASLLVLNEGWLYSCHYYCYDQ